jgi:hypothetical protein
VDQRPRKLPADARAAAANPAQRLGRRRHGQGEGGRHSTHRPVDPEQPCHEGQALPDGQRRAAQDVAFAGHPYRAGQQMPLRAVGDVDEAQLRVDDRLEAPVQVVEQEPGRA